MRTKPVIAGVVALALLLFIAFLIITAGKPQQDITVRHVGSIQSGDLLKVSFEISNRTTSRYFVYPVSAEISNRSGWEKCFNFEADPTILLSHENKPVTFEMTNLPTSSRLRLNMKASKDGLFLRLKLKVNGQALDPYEKNSQVYGFGSKIMVSEEWVETFK